jgi:hypothetical protein
MSYYSISTKKHNNVGLDIIKTHDLGQLPSFFRDERLGYDFVIEALTMLEKTGGLPHDVYAHIEQRLTEYEMDVVHAEMCKEPGRSRLLDDFVKTEAVRTTEQSKTLIQIQTSRLTYSQLRRMIPDEAVESYYEFDLAREFKYKFGN